MKLKKFSKVAIANRGEVAVRIIHACQQLGIKTILLHSEVDTQTRAYRMADQTVCIGPGPSAESYLNIQANIMGALSAGADAIHPGFGFLSENANFAQACADAGMVFIGPSPEAIALMGDKIKAKELVQKIGVPTIPGYNGLDQTTANLMREAKRIGYPVIAKASAGGGGRGLKIITCDEDAKPAIESAQREALAAFGDATVFLEKYLNQAKHIEVQVFCDVRGEAFYLFERECSVQRRHQKIIEEATSASLSAELRLRMCTDATKLAKAAGYLGAGTVEFLLQDGQYYFMEMNTRLQVEHPVTELILNVDLVKAQLLTAQGQELGWQQSQFIPKGHAIEARLYCEDPYKGGVPSIGKLGYIHFPEGVGRRFEYGFEAGDTLTPYYDSMIAKVIVWDQTRALAITKLQQVLRDVVVFGVKTNIPFLQEILAHPEFQDASMTTRFIQTYFDNALTESETNLDQIEIAKLAFKEISRPLHLQQSEYSPAASPWQGAWSNI